jgi:antirestriction protein
MNIFVLSNDPKIAAQDHCDKHCVKMVLELYRQLGSAVRRQRANFEWASEHAIALAEEYTYRYGKEHACEKGIHHLAEMREMIPEGGLTRFAQAMPDEYRDQCSVTAYKNYYWKDKRVNIDVGWNNNRDKPKWWKQLESIESQQIKDKL